TAASSAAHIARTRRESAAPPTAWTRRRSAPGLDSSLLRPLLETIRKPRDGPEDRLAAPTATADPHQYRQVLTSDIADDGHPRSGPLDPPRSSRMISYRSRLMASQILDVNEIDWATRRLLHGDQI